MTPSFGPNLVCIFFKSNKSNKSNNRYFKPIRNLHLARLKQQTNDLILVGSSLGIHLFFDYKTLKMLEQALVFDIIDDWDYILLGERVEKPMVPRFRLDLDIFDEAECLKKFRFPKHDLLELSILLLFPGTIVLENGCRVSWIRGILFYYEALPGDFMIKLRFSDEKSCPSTGFCMVSQSCL